jgi:predicted nucleotidyltransferase
VRGSASRVTFHFAMAPRPDVATRLGLARKGAEMLRARGARRVVLFGSLARGRPQDERSDIDLAVEGLPPALFFRTLSELDVALDIDVDLVALEDAPPALRTQIEQFGVELLP